MDEPAVALRGVEKRFLSGAEELRILREVDLTIEAGDAVGVTGESGSGKSTLLTIIAGLDRPTSGSVMVAGKELSSLSEEELSRLRARRVGFVFQFHHLLKDFTALENVLLPGLMIGGSRKGLEARAKELLGVVGLSNRLTHVPSQLSGGERQRVAVVRSLINRPALLLADEPTGNLDEGNSAYVADLLFRLVEETGTTLLLVTHDARLAARCPRRLLLEHGGLTPL
ncbi:MAG: ABC transporter ATP-binding protein [Alkalispirochaetaceae bacterium]